MRNNIQDTNLERVHQEGKTSKCYQLNTLGTRKNRDNECCVLHEKRVPKVKIYKRVALCLKCKHRSLGNPEQCPRCGNTRFRRCNLRKGELEKFMLMENKIYKEIDGASELVIAPKFGIEMPPNGESQSSVGYFNYPSIKGRCPFCGHSRITNGGIYLKNGVKNYRYKCLKCEKWFCSSNYFLKRTPDYIIDFFIDLFSSKEFLSQAEIAKRIFNKFGYETTQVTIGRWERQYRKGKLWKGRIPKARMNYLRKPEIEYIPKVVIFKQISRWGTIITRRNEYAKPMSQMQEISPIAIP